MQLILDVLLYHFRVLEQSKRNYGANSRVVRISVTRLHPSTGILNIYTQRDSVRYLDFPHTTPFKTNNQDFQIYSERFHGPGEPGAPRQPTDSFI